MAYLYIPTNQGTPALYSPLARNPASPVTQKPLLHCLVSSPDKLILFEIKFMFYIEYVIFSTTWFCSWWSRSEQSFFSGNCQKHRVLSHLCGESGALQIWADFCLEVNSALMRSFVVSESWTLLETSWVFDLVFHCDATQLNFSLLGMCGHLSLPSEYLGYCWMNITVRKELNELIIDKQMNSW